MAPADPAVVELQMTFTQAGDTSTLATAPDGSTAAATIAPIETTAALPVFRSQPGKSVAEVALVVTDRGAELSATSAPGAQTGLTAADALASAAKGAVAGPVELTLGTATGKPDRITVRIAPDDVLVARVPEDLVALADQKAITLVAMTVAKRALGVKPSQLRGVLIEVGPGK